MRFSLHDKALDQVIEVNSKSLLGQADRDVFKIDVNGDVLGLDTQQGFQWLENDFRSEFRAFQNIFRTPDTDTSVTRCLDTANQRYQITAGCCQDQLVNRIGIK